VSQRGELDEITGQIVGAAIDVHRALGPGLLESVYESCLEYDLIERKLNVQRQVALPVSYKQVKLESGYRVDLLVEKRVIVEIKSVEQIAPIHKAQLLTYLKLSNLKVGLLINFNVDILKKGINRVVHNY
jgi:GxxExxY protein